VAVACSGGRDSTALLHATVQASMALNRKVVALHVHHGLNPQADAWLGHVQQQCENWAAQGLPVVFEARRLQTHPSQGQSIEAWARQARYAALADMAKQHGAPWVLLAHHRQDQAETFLLQALRGAGLAGLSAMPKVALRHGLIWLRPWLDVPVQAIAAYVQAQGLAHIEDDSNTDVRFARNRLRHEVWPHLAHAFEQAPAVLAQSAHWAQEALQCLAELAVHDLAQMASTQGLQRAAWLCLSAPRRSNALRAWLLQETGQAARATLVLRLMAELPSLDAGRWPCAQGELQLYRGVLRYADAVNPETSESALPQAQALSLAAGAGVYALPAWGGVLSVFAVDEGGIPTVALKNLVLRARQGGEQFQSGPDRPPRSLKKQYQAAAIPSWQRNGPLIGRASGHLVFVPGLGVDARQWAARGEAQWGFGWCLGASV
jgi:tRNA(Ile)-lysidine synthase